MFNLDSTDTRLVVKGVTVAKDGAVGKVVKTSHGVCLVIWGNNRYPNPERCAQLTVLNTGRRTGPMSQEQKDLRNRVALMNRFGLRASAERLKDIAHSLVISQD